MKERPILFSGPMVRAILNGGKTQTRRIVKPQPFATNAYHDGSIEFSGWARGSTGDPIAAKFSVGAVGGGANLIECSECPYGTAGDRLWVREMLRQGSTGNHVEYAADNRLVRDESGAPMLWLWKRSFVPPMHCPRKSSRITLEITGVRVERLQEISKDDAIAEGIDSCPIEGWINYLWHGDPRRQNID